ncbi:MAG: hypothetical protein U0457_19990 [Candidatus Sericytochromatia bacterium]
MKKLLLAVGLTSLIFTSCARDAELVSEMPQASISSVSNAKNEIVLNKAEIKTFLSDISKMGVKLSDDQMRIISKQRHTKPNGLFAPRPALNLTAEQNLNTHFDKHKSQFPAIKTKDEYLKTAIAYLNNNSPTAKYYFDVTSFAKGYQSNVVKWDSKTNELSAVREDGAVTTYYRDNKMDPKRFVVVPAEFVYE